MSDDYEMSEQELQEWRERRAQRERYVAEDGCTIVVDKKEVPYLEAKFSKLNRLFFGGQLPSYRIQAGEIDTESGYEAMTGSGSVKGHCDNSRRVITLGSVYLFSGWSDKEHDRFVHETLLHEMCHIGLPLGAGHKEPFLRKLKLLHQQGEDWAGDQIKHYLFENRLQKRADKTKQGK